jgi:hypothetical protein
MLQSSQSQPLLSPEELSDTGENLPKGAPAAPVADRDFGIDNGLSKFWRSVEAQLVTWTWYVPSPPLVGLQCYAHYSVCFYFSITGVCHDVPQLLPGNPTSTSTDVAHGWDLFVHGLDDTTKGEMGVIDPILINYANFVGDELRAFHHESAHLLMRLKKLDDDMSYDHDAVVKVDQSLEFLKTLVTANAISIQQTDINIKGLTTAS